ncbi:MAG TPA: DUF4394 domain-containing protein [Gemmataceae bacterium]|nr:DUF4394 domain-containing protein [Gemmataceae bacterium]
MARTPKQKNLTVEILEAREVPAVAYALTDFSIVASANQLVSFDTATPGTVTATKSITGLVAGDSIVGIDFRPVTGQLYGVGANTAANTVQVYTINPATGAATAVGTPQNVATIAGATAFGVDFNPLADRIRVITDLPSDGGAAGSNTNNFRLNPTTGALVAIDPDLDYTLLAGGVADGPEVTVAYTNSANGPAPATTQLLGIVSGGDDLVQHTTAPGFQTLGTVGSLGVDTSDAAGLDIYGADNKAVAILTTAGGPGLYTVNLATGAATLVGTVGNGLTALSDVAVAAALDPVAVSGSADGKVQLFTSTSGTGQAALGANVTAFAGSTTAVRATTGDVNGDGTEDIIAVTGPGTAIRVTVISGVDNTTVLVPAFDPFGGNFQGGGFVSAGDLDADGKAEFIVSPDQGGGPRVTIFSRNADGSVATRANFFGIDDPDFRGGARTAVGDVNGDGKLDLAVAAGFLGGPRVALFNGTTVLSSTPTRLIGDFFAFPGTDAVTLRNGVYVAISDIDGDGKGDMVFGGGPGGAPRVFILDGELVAANNVAGAQAAPIANFFVANNSSDRGGVRVAAADLDGDAKGDLAVGSGEGSAANVRLYRGVNFTSSAEPTVFQDVAVFGGAALPGGVFVG